MEAPDAVVLEKFKKDQFIADLKLKDDPWFNQHMSAWCLWLFLL
jgi:hypothetical protein